MQIRACVIKSYRGAVGYDDGNVDILVGSDEFGHIARRLLREESCSVGVWQRVRHRIYEPNKLMIDPPRPGLRRLHLHRSVGWHGIDVIESECVLRSAGLVRIGANHVSVPSKEMESLILVLHIVLETFEKSELDRAFIEESAFRCFGERYNVLAMVRDRRVAGRSPTSPAFQGAVPFRSAAGGSRSISHEYIGREGTC
jgi:hypothetical protein